MRQQKKHFVLDSCVFPWRTINSLNPACEWRTIKTAMQGGNWCEYVKWLLLTTAGTTTWVYITQNAIGFNSLLLPGPLDGFMLSRFLNFRFIDFGPNWCWLKWHHLRTHKRLKHVYSSGPIYTLLKCVGFPFRFVCGRKIGEKVSLQKQTCWVYRVFHLLKWFPLCECSGRHVVETLRIISTRLPLSEHGFSLRPHWISCTSAKCYFTGPVC